MRSRKGRITGAVLNEAAVRNMRLRDSKLREAGTPGLDVRAEADKFDVGPETIRRILRWDTWRWVGEEGPGADAAAWAQPASEAAAAESKARFLAMAAAEGLLQQPTPQEEPTGSGLARLQAEAALITKPDKLLQEAQNLIDTRSTSVVDSGDGGHPPATDGGSSEDKPR